MLLQTKAAEEKSAEEKAAEEKAAAEKAAEEKAAAEKAAEEKAAEEKAAAEKAAAEKAAAEKAAAEKAAAEKAKAAAKKAAEEKAAEENKAIADFLDTHAREEFSSKDNPMSEQNIIVIGQASNKQPLHSQGRRLGQIEVRKLLKRTYKGFTLDKKVELLNTAIENNVVYKSFSEAITNEAKILVEKKEFGKFRNLINKILANGAEGKHRKLIGDLTKIQVSFMLDGENFTKRENDEKKADDNKRNIEEIFNGMNLSDQIAILKMAAQKAENFYTEYKKALNEKAAEEEALDKKALDKKAAEEKAAAEKAAAEKAAEEKAAEEKAAEEKALNEKAAEEEALDKKALDKKAAEEKAAAEKAAEEKALNEVALDEEALVPAVASPEYELGPLHGNFFLQVKEGLGNPDFPYLTLSESFVRTATAHYTQGEYNKFKEMLEEATKSDFFRENLFLLTDLKASPQKDLGDALDEMKGNKDQQKLSELKEKAKIAVQCGADLFWRADKAEKKEIDGKVYFNFTPQDSPIQKAMKFDQKFASQLVTIFNSEGAKLNQSRVSVEQNIAKLHQEICAVANNGEISHEDKKPSLKELRAKLSNMTGANISELEKCVDDCENKSSYEDLIKLIKKQLKKQLKKQPNIWEYADLPLLNSAANILWEESERTENTKMRATAVSCRKALLAVAETVLKDVSGKTAINPEQEQALRCLFSVYDKYPKYKTEDRSRSVGVNILSVCAAILYQITTAASAFYGAGVVPFLGNNISWIRRPTVFSGEEGLLSDSAKALLEGFMQRNPNFDQKDYNRILDKIEPSCKAHKELLELKEAAAAKAAAAKAAAVKEAAAKEAAAKEAAAKEVAVKAAAAKEAAKAAAELAAKEENIAKVCDTIAGTKTKTKAENIAKVSDDIDGTKISFVEKIISDKLQQNILARN
jgi:hypothetical protein